MMKAWSLFLLVSLLLGSVHGVAFKKGSGFYLYEGKEDATAVIEFKPGRDFKDSKAPKIVIFYSPFCGHCINYAPKYMQLAKDVTAKYPEVEFWAVSCKSHRDECAKHTIRGYPTIHSYKAGNETSIVLGSNANEAQIVKALQLDRPFPEVDRKLVLEEDKEDETVDTDEVKEAMDEVNEATDKDKEATDEDKEATDKDEDTREEESQAVDEDNDTDKKTDEREAKESEQHDESEEEADANEKPADVDKTEGQKDADESEEQDAADESEDQKDADESEEQDAADESKEQDAVGESKVQDDPDGTKGQADVDESKEQDTADESKEQDDAVESDEQADADESEEQADAEESEEQAELVESEEQAHLVESDEPEDSDEDEDETEASEEEEGVDADEDKDTDADEDEDETVADEDEDSDGDEDEEEAEGRRKRRKEHDSPVSEDIEGSKDDAPRDAHSITDAVKAYRAQNEANSGVKSDAGALKGKKETRDMDKWRQIIAERRKSLEKRKALLRKVTAKMAEPGATKVMKANTPGTTEYSNRVQSLLKKINTLRKKRGVTPLTTQVEITKKAKNALKKEVKKPGLAEKVPIIKRLVKMTPEEENILDSSLSFMAGLKYGLFMTNDALTAKQRAALKGWLDLLSVSLPPEWGLHALIDELNGNIDTVAQGNEHLLRVLRKHPLPRSIYSASCRKPGSPGFSCGLWKLFHTATVGIAEHRGGLNLVQSEVVAADTRIFSPADAAATIREYIAHFFGCTECRNHFIAKYDQCSFRRCDRLTSDAVAASPDDWKQLPLWLWEVHNDVSVRVAHEKIERQIESSNNLSRMKVAVLTRTDEIKHLFPSLETCFQCFDENGSWDEDAVFEYLEASYWSGPDAMADKLLQYKDSDAKGSGSGFFWFFAIVLLTGVYIMRGRKGGLQRSMNAALVTGRKLGGKKRSV